eukprot:6213802-Pleurochrysis_carterae.AAC.2
MGASGPLRLTYILVRGFITIPAYLYRTRHRRRPDRLARGHHHRGRVGGSRSPVPTPTGPAGPAEIAASPTRTALVFC